jgi:hypothetical protein
MQFWKILDESMLEVNFLVGFKIQNCILNSFPKGKLWNSVAETFIDCTLGGLNKFEEKIKRNGRNLI